MPAPSGPPRRAVVLLSGGLDSATALAVARSDGFDTFALSVDYGQRHRVELDAAAAVARQLGATKHAVIAMDLRAIGGSALTAEIDVPKDRPESQISHGIPVTYVPARNMVMLSLAVGWAEVLGARDVFIGVNQLDYSGYPDCRAEFIRAFEHAATLGTKAGAESSPTEPPIHIRTPLISLSKAQIITLGVSLGVDFSLTTSCYDPLNGLACGRCDSCQLRRKGFQQANIPDPTRYAF